MIHFINYYYYLMISNYHQEVYSFIILNFLEVFHTLNYWKIAFLTIIILLNYYKYYNFSNYIF
jgi:hypothetical protein